MGTNLEHELIPLLEKLQSAADALYDSVATTMPIDYNDPVQVAEADKAHAEFDEEMKGLRIRFLSYLALDGADLVGVADLFAQPGDRWETPNSTSVYCNLANASGQVNDVEMLVRPDDWRDPGPGGWHGAAAAAFQTNFLVPFARAGAAQAKGAMEVGIAAQAFDSGVDRAKQAVLDLCRLAIERFGGASTGASAGVLAILADTVSLFRALDGDTAVDFLLSGAGVVCGLIAEADSEPGEGKDKPIDIAYAPTARELIPQVYLALSELDEQLAELDDQVNAGLETDLGAQGPLGAPSAKIQDPGLDPSAYQQPNFRPLPGEPYDKLVVDVVQLYYAGYRSLPQAAALYDLSVKACGSVHLGNLQVYFPRSVAKFTEAVGQFSGLLGAVRDDLTRTGAAIVTAAKNYEYTDTTEAAQIAQCIADIPPPPQDRPLGDEHYTPPDWLLVPGWHSPTATAQTAP